MKRGFITASLAAVMFVLGGCAVEGASTPSAAKEQSIQALPNDAILATLNRPLAAAIGDANFIYAFAESTSGAGYDLVKVHKETGTIAVLASTADRPAAIAIDSTSVYWGGGAVHKVSIEGGAVVDLTASGYVIVEQGLVTDGTHVFFASFWDDHLYEVAASGGPVTAYGAPGLYTLQIQDGYVYWGTVDKVARIPVEGGAETVVDANVNSLSDITVSESGVLEGAYRAIRSVSQPGGVATTLASFDSAVQAMFPQQMGDDVYYLDQTSSTLQRVPVGGATPTVLAEDVLWYAIDATSLYRLDKSGELHKTAR